MVIQSELLPLLSYSGLLSGILSFFVSAEQKVPVPKKPKEITTIQVAWKTPILTFSPDAKVLAYVENGTVIRLWDLEKRKECAFIKCPVPVFTLAFSPDGKKLAWGGEGENLAIHIWDLTKQKETAQLKGHTGAVVFTLAFSPDGKLLASGGFNDYTVRIWDIAKGEARAVIPMRKDTQCVRKVQFHPDGKTVACLDDIVRAWDATTGKEIRAFSITKKESMANDFAFASDGRTIAGATDSGIAKIWDYTTGEVKKTVKAHNDIVTDVAFSRYGKTLITASVDKKEPVKIWDVETQKELAQFPHEPGGLCRMALDANDKTLAVIFDNPGKIKLWDISSILDRQQTQPAKNAPEKKPKQ